MEVRGIERGASLLSALGRVQRMDSVDAWWHAESMLGRPMSKYHQVDAGYYGVDVPEDPLVNVDMNCSSAPELAIRSSPTRIGWIRCR